MQTRDVHQHVRRVLSMLDPSVELMETGRRFIEQSGKPDWGLRGAIPAWCLDQIKRLTGAASFAEAARNPDVRTLVAFAYLGVSRHPEWRAAEVDPSTSVPPALAALEPDFFAVLLKNVREHLKTSASFRARIKASERDVAAAVGRLAEMAQPEVPRRPTRGRTTRPAKAAASDAVGFGIGMVVVWAVVTWIRNGVDKD